jgi:hypothetical protein
LPGTDWRNALPAKRIAKVAAKPARKTRGRLVPVTVGMLPEMIDLLDQAAERANRSRTNLIDTWLAERLQQEGYSVRGSAA